jgi:SagB-type dehydrogenase family enzyme
LPLEHSLCLIRETDDLARPITEATLGQDFVGSAPVVFIWSCVPYRGEWRYHIAAHKIMLLDAGHLCQNLYLGCEAIGCGTCAIAAYDQRLMDALVGVDGDEEFVVYLAPVGRVRR